jgi:ABC-type sugar transport system ATPase subunit
MSDPSGQTPFWQMQGVSKHYGGVRALQGVDFACERGRIHAVLGENGAGKSTLIKVMAGVVQPSEGAMFLEGREVAFTSPVEANSAGIVCIFQELTLMPDLSVADNICITAPPKTRLGLIDSRDQRRRTEALLARVGCEDIDPRERVRNLPLSRRQMVAISIKAAIAALQGNALPQLISVPIPVADVDTLEDGVNFWSDLTDNFFTPNEFPPCDVNITAVQIMAQTEADVLE